MRWPAISLKKDLAPLLTETWLEFQNDEAGQRGAALAYYATFSFFPLLILLLAALGFVLQYEPAASDAQHELLRVVARQVSPQFSRTLREVLATLQDGAPSATGVGLFILWFSASSVFQQLDETFNKIWRVPDAPLSQSWFHYAFSFARGQVLGRLLAFVMVLLVGLLLVLSLAVTASTQAVLQLLAQLPLIGASLVYLGSWLTALALNTLIFALLFKFLPDTRVAWRDVAGGALLTALIWEFAKRLFAFYLAHSSYMNAYGVVGKMLGLMLWLYFSSQVLFLGAEFTEVYSRHHGSRKGMTKTQGVAPVTASGKTMPEAPAAPLPPTK